MGDWQGVSDSPPRLSDQSPDDDPVDELLRLSDSDPVEALDWISRLTGSNLPHEPVILFARFNALRHLATDRLVNAGLTSPGSGTSEEVVRLFDADEVSFAEHALRTVAELEAIQPSYFSSRDFLEEKVDIVASALERVKPGASQGLMGWSKVAYFGFDRIRFLPGTTETVPNHVLAGLLKTRFRVPEPVRQAIVLTVVPDGPNDHQATIFLLHRGMEDDEKVSDVLAGELNVHTSREARFTSEKSSPQVDTSGLTHPNRDHLLSEAEMLLRHETDKRRRAYLEQLMAWLQGMGPKPETPPDQAHEAGGRAKVQRSLFGPANLVALVVAALTFLRQCSALRDMQKRPDVNAPGWLSAHIDVLVQPLIWYGITLCLAMIALSIWRNRKDSTG